MKVALCIHGLSAGDHTIKRKGKTKKFSITPNLNGIKLLREKYNVDIFIHTWNDNFKNEINEIYKPCLFTIERVDEEVKRKVVICDQYPNHKIFVSETPLSSCIYSKFSNYYSMYQANQLKKQWENNHNFKYNCVIHTRFDIKFVISNIEMYDLNKIIIPTTAMYMKKKELIDYLFLSSSENMDQFVNIYYYLPKLIKKLHFTIKTNNHEILAQYCKDNETINNKIERVLRNENLFSAKQKVPFPISSIRE